MRLGILALASALFFAAPGAAQTSVTLRADPVPIVDARINDRPIRLEVDLRLPEALALSTAAAERLGVRRVPFAQIAVGIEGSDALLRGRIARPRLLFDGRSSRAFAGVFPAPVSSRADGVIGPAALPYDVITVVLGPEPEGARTITFAMDDPDEWEVAAEVGGRSVRINFDIGQPATILNRAAVRMFDDVGAIPAAGDLAQTPLILGLSTLMQPVTTELSFAGLPFGPTLARTNAPLLGATEADAIVVQAEARNAPEPTIAIGRTALARCASISVDRRARRLTLRCA